MPEAWQAGVPNDQVQADDRDGDDQDARADRDPEWLLEDAGRNRQQDDRRQHQRKADSGMAHARCANRPAGRTSSTMAISR